MDELLAGFVINSLEKLLKLVRANKKLQVISTIPTIIRASYNP